MGKWKTINKKRVYENDFLAVRQDEVIDPNGNQGKRNVVEMGGGSVIVIAENEDRELYLVGQSRYAVDEYSWEFVSGGIKPDEEVLTAAKRELAEELGLTASDWFKLGVFHPSNSLMDRQAHVYLVKDLAVISGKTQGDDYEKIDTRTVPANAVKQEINSGKIKDALTICAFYYYLNLSRNR